MERTNPWLVGLLAAIGVQSVVIGGLLYSTASQKQEAAKPGAPSRGEAAKVDQLSASNVKRISLTARAVDRLDVKTTPVRLQEVVRKRNAEGEVLASPEAIVVTAPVAGIISLPEGVSAAVPGMKLSAGQAVLRLTAPSTRLAEADPVRLTATVSRAPRQGQQAAVQAAAPVQPPAPAALSLQAPRDSRLVRLHVQPGQAVDAGQPLFEVADYVGALVRVPLAGDVNRVAREKPVRILPINAKDAKTPAGGWTAQAAQAPQGTDPKEAANALYYVVEEAGPELAPGQRVRAEFQLAGSAKQRLTVPYAAVIYDPRGEAWVYTNPEPLVFVRHRINVDYIEDGLAVLSDGPVAGTPVVMTGASELFGTEYKLGY
ncbi:MAG TPA: HlyD family secretion protein [Chloroflexota bacterium]|jgi:hypothetical protein|nr:HlyD family secretion protein [Chloroflexota bacterium]